MLGELRKNLTGQVKLDLNAKPDFRGGGFLSAVRWREKPTATDAGFPFDVPAIRALERIEFHPAVTFFIGENGSGKSTLLEAIAIRYGFNPEGGDLQHKFSTHDSHSGLSERLILERNFGRATDGWYLRAESFYNFASYMAELDADPDTAHGHHAYGGRALHEQSHGEAFLALLKERLQGGGIYIFDEPESALSPQRQLSVLTLLHRLVFHRSQLVIATHSPILLSYPHARIYEFGPWGIRETSYEDTENFQITRDFLNRRERMLEILLAAEEDDLERKRR